VVDGTHPLLGGNRSCGQGLGLCKEPRQCLSQPPGCPCGVLVRDERSAGIPAATPDNTGISSIGPRLSVLVFDSRMFGHGRQA